MKGFFFTCYFLLYQSAFSLAEGISYASFGSEATNNKYATLDELVEHSTNEEPAVIFQFNNYDFMQNIANLHNDNHRFFKGFFSHGIGRVYKTDSSIELNENEQSNAIFSVSDISSSASELFYNYELDNKKNILINLNNVDYDFSLLDEFIESALLFVKESFENYNLVLHNANSSSHISKGTIAKSIKEAIENRVDEDSSPENDNKKKHDTDEDILSEFWTEGLLMCLMVSGLLLFVLVIALQWISSLEISYGALERKVDDLKKTN
ncbi:hypothetical protein TBLA_0E00560 [Henningerozyma blattae CBS 6284]|uniref:V-type proton ATPase subunit S1/VOA1 transmembrane domain-containing protein n=1 Tax=Henningerozyma blattae (strain ATCC 34711 / CBS 6284 / DSM 70876 / NBRC 10599 / NRRL Y-10934 / UCD 77-7) TaxID=1071380 RepID=I2H415_HENB6|nr:hypothetical protein TBLA_0E00560 [Tetrapisispora blattae CBS 6284]CCH61117.1 hypothetical protein TBLA_0E00560 [Tetrapisispora blattae CBS 6284]